jgi:hypothetical protein
MLPAVSAEAAGAIARSEPAGPSSSAAYRLGRKGPCLRDDDVVTRWIRSYWDEEDVTFYWEVGDDGWVTRHVELAGPDLTPRAASCLEEWMRELRAGRIREYAAKYGSLADQPVTQWDPDFPHEDLTREEYEKVWLAARRFLE